MKIRLNTANELVGYFEIPPFQKLPEVMVWGDRTFQLRNVEPPPMDDCAAIFDEVCAFVIVTERVR